MEFVSIGPYCNTADILKQHNLRLKSYPFDYIFSSLSMITHCINDRFNVFLDKQYYSNGTTESSTRHSFYCDYLDTEILYRHHMKYGYDSSYKVSSGNVFNHHNLLNESIYEKFQRRCARLLDLIDNHKKVVFVYYNCYTKEFDDLLEFHNTFSGSGSDKNIFTLGIFDNDGNTEILYESSNCKIYQNYGYADIFADVATLF